MKETVERGIHSPPDGWKEDSFYIVDVAIDSISPIVKAILFTGKLNASNAPAEKSLLFNAEFGKIYSAGIVHFMEAVATLDLEDVAVRYVQGASQVILHPEKVEELARDVKQAQDIQTAKEEGSKANWKENLL